MDFGASVVIKGEIIASENVVIAGRVEGSIRITEGAELTLAAGSAVVGDVDAHTVTILGQVSGNVTASGRIAVRTTAVVEGTLKTPTLSVTEGAQIVGRVEMPSRERAEVVAFPVAV